MDTSKLLAEFLDAPEMANEKSAFQRKFKIKGAIREVGQILPYISLLKQIAEGQGKGYSETDIFNTKELLRMYRIYV